MRTVRPLMLSGMLIGAALLLTACGEPDSSPAPSPTSTVLPSIGTTQTGAPAPVVTVSTGS